MPDRRPADPQTHPVTPAHVATIAGITRARNILQGAADALTGKGSDVPSQATQMLEALDDAALGFAGILQQLTAPPAPQPAVTIQISPNGSHPPDKVAEAELHFQAGPLQGLKLIGFSIWKRRTDGGYNVTFPARSYQVNGERRSFALLRPCGDSPNMAADQDRIRDLVLDAWTQHQDDGAHRHGEISTWTYDQDGVRYQPAPTLTVTPAAQATLEQIAADLEARRQPTAIDPARVTVSQDRYMVTGIDRPGHTCHTCHVPVTAGDRTAGRCSQGHTLPTESWQEPDDPGRPAPPLAQAAEIIAALEPADRDVRAGQVIASAIVQGAARRPRRF